MSNTYFEINVDEITHVVIENFVWIKEGEG